MNHEESVIQAGICRTLQEAGVFFFSIPNEGAGDDRRRQMTMMAMGLRPGVADLCVWWPKEDGLVTVGFLEVKTRNGRQSTSQRKFEMLCRIRGVPYSVVRSVEDVEGVSSNNPWITGTSGVYYGMKKNMVEILPFNTTNIIDVNPGLAEQQHPCY